MKTQSVIHPFLRPPGLFSVLAGFALVATLLSADRVLAQNLMVDSFPDASTVQVGSSPGLDWVNYRGDNVAVTWDPNQTSPGNPNPGAMYVTVDWPATGDPSYTTAWTDMQFAFSTGGSFDSSNYTAFECDIKVDVTNSSARFRRKRLRGDRTDFEQPLAKRRRVGAIDRDQWLAALRGLFFRHPGRNL